MYIMQYVSYELLQSNYKLSQMKTKTQPVVSKDFLLHSLCYLLFHVSRYLDSLYLFYVVLVNNCVLLNIRMKITVFNFLLVSTHTCSASCSHFFLSSSERLGPLVARQLLSLRPLYALIRVLLQFFH